MQCNAPEPRFMSMPTGTSPALPLPKPRPWRNRLLKIAAATAVTGIALSIMADNFAQNPAAQLLPSSGVSLIPPLLVELKMSACAITAVASNYFSCSSNLHPEGQVTYSSTSPPDPAYWLSGIQDSWVTLEQVPKEVISHEIALAAVRNDGYALKWVPEELRTSQIVRAATERSVIPLDWIPKEFITHEIALRAADRYTDTLLWVPKELLTHKIALAAVRIYGYALKWVPKELLTHEIALAAVHTSGCALHLVPKELLTHEIVLAAIQSSGFALQWAPKEMLTREIVLATTQKWGWDILSGGLPRELITEEFVRLAASKLDTAIFWTSSRIAEGAEAFSVQALESALQKALTSLPGMGATPTWGSHLPSFTLLNKNALRYEENLLQKAKLEAAEFNSQDPRNKLLWLRSVNESDSAFYFETQDLFFKRLTDKFQIKQVDFTSAEQMCKAIELYGDRLAGLIISAHGSQHGIGLAPNDSLMTIEDIPKNCFSGMHPYAAIYLEACLTASSTDSHPNFAFQLHEMAQRPVIAATKYLYRGPCTVLEGANLTDIRLYSPNFSVYPTSHEDQPDFPPEFQQNPHRFFCNLEDRIDVTYTATT